MAKHPPSPGHGTGVDSAAQSIDDDAEHTSIAWVILTQGDRPSQLTRLLDSLPKLRFNDEVIIVANGGPTPPVPADVHVVVSKENLGIPGGRNLGASKASADVVVFIDDDAYLSPAFDVETLTHSLDNEIAAISFRIVDPETGGTLRRHVPRLGGAGTAGEPGVVTAFLGGAVAIDRNTFLSVGGFWEDLFYGHEETELGWRLFDAGKEILYLPSLVVHHPATDPATSHSTTYWTHTVRNRVLIARRTLPIACGLLYLAIWIPVSLMRALLRQRLRVALRAVRSGFTIKISRRPIRWRTVMALTRAGRPPIV